MEIFAEAKGYATRKTAEAKLAKVLPDYTTYRWMVVALPSGRFLPVVQVAGSPAEWLAGTLAHLGVGVM